MAEFISTGTHHLFGEERRKRHFINFFKSKKKIKVRPGAMMPEEVKKIVNEIGKGKRINIRRVEYDGTPEETPVSLRILDIRDDHFTGKIVNVERSIKQELDDKLVKAISLVSKKMWMKSFLTNAIRMNCLRF